LWLRVYSIENLDMPDVAVDMAFNPEAFNVSTVHFASEV
jgi:hypothetical protein